MKKQNLKDLVTVVESKTLSDSREHQALLRSYDSVIETLHHMTPYFDRHGNYHVDDSAKHNGAIKIIMLGGGFLDREKLVVGKLHLDKVRYDLSCCDAHDRPDSHTNQGSTSYKVEIGKIKSSGDWILDVFDGEESGKLRNIAEIVGKEHKKRIALVFRSDEPSPCYYYPHDC